MSKLIPPRPRYRKERLWAGFPTLAVFALLLAARLLFQFTVIPADSLPPRLIATLSALFLPIVVFLVVRGRGYGSVLRLRMPRAAHASVLITAFIALVCGTLLLSVLCGGLDTLGTTLTVFASVRPKSLLHGTLLSLLSGVLPAILEELFFRGILVTEYERRGAVRAVLMSALLFSLCHFDMANFPAYAFAGILLAIVVFATDSLYAAMLLQIPYTVLLLLFGQYANTLYRITGSIELFLFLLVLLLLLSLLILFRCAAKIYRLREQNGLPDPRRSVPYNVQLYTTLDALSDPPVVLCILLSVVGFIAL